MGAIFDKIFCTDKYEWGSISRWLDISESLLKEVRNKELSVLHAADFGGLLEQMIQKDVESCTEREELEFLDGLAVRLAEFVKEDQTKEYVSLLYWVADVMAEGMERYEEALNVSGKALELAKIIYGENCWRCAAYYNLTGNLCYVLEEYEKGTEYCEKAIDILNHESPKYADNQSIRNEIEGQLAVFYSDAGVMYLRMKKYQKGHECIIAAETWLKGIKPRDRMVDSKVFCNIGTFFEIMGNSQRALRYMEKAVRIYRKKKMMREFRIAGLCGLMSLGYANVQKNRQAIYYGEIAREVRERMLGEESLEARQMHSSLGVLYMMKPHLKKKGRSMLEKSMHNIELLGKEDYLDAAYVCIRSSIGYLEYGRHERKKGLFCLDEGARLLELATGGRDWDKQVLYENIASQYYDAGEYKQAAKYQSLLIEKRKALFETCDENTKKQVGKMIADHIAGFGQFYIKMGQNARAIEQYEEAFRFCTSVFGKNSDMAGSICLTLSQLYMEVGDIDSSRERGEMAYQIAKKVYGKQSRITAMTEQYLNQMVREPKEKEEISLTEKIMEFLFGKKE